MTRNILSLTRQDYTRNMTAQPVPADAPAGTEIWFSDNGKQFSATCFTGKAQKPSIHNLYRTAEGRQTHVDNWLSNIIANAAYKAEIKQARKEAACPFQVGDILTGSWGYDQTNQEFCQIIAISGKKITLRNLAHKTVPGSEGFMCEMVKPVKNRFYGEPFSRIAQTYNGNDWYVKYNDHCDLSTWNGKPKYASHYA